MNQASNDSETRNEISEALDPITLQMMKIPAGDLVDKMSSNMVNWLADSAIAWAKKEGDDSFDKEIEYCEPEVEYIPVPI